MRPQGGGYFAGFLAPRAFFVVDVGGGEVVLGGLVGGLGGGSGGGGVVGVPGHADDVVGAEGDFFRKDFFASASLMMFMVAGSVELGGTVLRCASTTTRALPSSAGFAALGEALLCHAMPPPRWRSCPAVS
jgi:hypothetical protein